MSFKEFHGYISKERAEKFMNEILNIEYSPIQGPCQENLNYLNRIILSFMNKIQFQNLTFISRPPENRTLPTLPEVVDTVLSGVGELCYTNNVGLYFLLQTLGFSVYLIIASVALRGTNNHVAIVASHVAKPGDTYLVECGLGTATFSAICLDFEAESDVIEYSYNVAKYMKKDGEYLRLHKPSRNLVDYPILESGWIVAYTFKLEPLTIEVLSELMLKSYTSSHFVFGKTLRAVSFSNNTATAMKTVDKKAIILKEDSNKLIVTDEYMVDTQREEFANHMIELFPMIPKSAISKAVENYLKVIS